MEIGIAAIETNVYYIKGESKDYWSAAKESANEVGTGTEIEVVRDVHRYTVGNLSEDMTDTQEYAVVTGYDYGGSFPCECIIYSHPEPDETCVATGWASYNSRLSLTRTFTSEHSTGDSVTLAGNYDSSVGFIAFDLSLITSIQEVMSVTLRLYCTAIDLTNDLEIYGYSGEALTEFAYAYIESTALGTISSSETTGFISVTLNEDGVEYINDHLGESLCVLCICSSEMDTAPTSGDEDSATFASAEHVTPMCRPTLVISAIKPVTWAAGLPDKPIQRVKRGNTVRLKAYTYTKKKVAASPTSATVTITDTDGTAYVTDGAMTEDDTGEMVYDYTVPSDTPVGIRVVKYTVTDGGGTLATHSVLYGSFEVIT